MGFYKNSNTAIRELQPNEKVEIGGVGKIVDFKEKDINIQTVGTRPKYHFSCIANQLSSYDPNFLSTINIEDLYDVVTSEEITQEYDHIKDKITTYYRVVPVLGGQYDKYKRAATIIRHACYDCAFHGTEKCSKSPLCHLKSLHHIVGLTREDLEGLYFFEKGEVTTERVSSEHKTCTRDSYDPYSGFFNTPRSYYY